MDTKQCRGLLLLGFCRAMYNIHVSEYAFGKLKSARRVEHTKAERLYNSDIFFCPHIIIWVVSREQMVSISYVYTPGK